jgi:hypothetical protein
VNRYAGGSSFRPRLIENQHTMPRSRLGPLAIETKLGDDPSTSSVWRAIHVEQRKAVAVKVFSAPFGGTPEARQVFADEWEQLKLLKHPGLAQCYGGGFEEADAYLANELIDGETLSSQMIRTGKLSWENTLEIAQGLADALEYLHARGIVHGSISCDKIIIAGFAPVLLDVRVDRFGSPFRSSNPPSIESIARQAPELVATGLNTASSRCSVASDLYQLGALIYQCITGRPPVSGETIQEVRANSQTESPEPAASIVMQCPVWFDKLIMQLLEKDPANRPPSATAVKLALQEVRKRSLSRTGVAEHASSGFSPLQVTNQREKDEARKLLGRGVIDLNAAEEQDEIPDATVWHDQPWFLFGGLLAILLMLAYVAWPASEQSLRDRAERLIDLGTRSALAEAEKQPLRELMVRFPDGPNATWAKQQTDRINAIQFLHQLSFKIKKNLAISNQGELLHKQAQQLSGNGQIREAIDKYHSMITVLGDAPEYENAVNAARYQIEILQQEPVAETDAEKIIRARLREAEQLLSQDRLEESRKIWNSLVELYGENADLKPLIDQARQRLVENP